MAKVKIIIAAIGGAVLFLLGIFAGRTGRHKQDGTDSDISDAGRLATKERNLSKVLNGLDDEISVELNATRTELDELAATSETHGNRKPSTRRSFSEIRKRNGLE